MLFKEINQKFTEKVAEYLNKGYTINASTMRGSQGEIAAIDITDGQELFRIMLDGFRDGEILRATEGIELVVGRCTDNCRINEDDSWGILWNNNLEIIERKRFYLVGESRTRKFYGTLAEAAEAQQLRRDRYHRNGCAWHREDHDITSDKAIDIVIPYIRRIKGVQRVNRKEVGVKKVIRHNGRNTYEVSYYNKTYQLQ